MTLFLVMAAMLAFISFPDSRPLPPGSEAAFLSAEIVEADCREELEPDSALEKVQTSRASNFRIFGQSTCHRPVFAASERDVFIEAVVRSESVKAKQIALKVSSLLKQERGKNSGPLAVKVAGVEEPRLQTALEALYRAELVAVMGAGEVRVANSAGSADGSQEARPVLLVKIRRVDAPDLISKVSLVMDDGRGEIRWLEL
jgi:hypothetical protein